MPKSVPVRCPACRREHVYTAPSYPCACGAPVAPPLDRGTAPEPVTHRGWDEDWITVRCGACGRRDQWPRPELGCPCGTVLRITVAGTASQGPAAGTRSPAPDGPATDAYTRAPADGASPGTGAHSDSASPGGDPADGAHTMGTADTAGVTATAAAAGAPAARPAFRPVAIRTARDAVTTAALYLRWLGYEGIRRADQRPPSGIGLAARGLVAHVDPAMQPASLRDVECLWLTAMTESAGCVYFSLAGYSDAARSRADALGVPLFVLDLTGTPQPVNAPADALNATGT
ncbi:hypothetical protein ACH4UM_30055 [Streptomyces sp. NPDC020801]|uniref:hypothetical protein n=1 Tax=unclassified Streptomyces TaxID=2593676 RepID=UPI0037B793AD